MRLYLFVHRRDTCSVTSVGEVREVLSDLHSKLTNRNMCIDRFRAQMAQTEAFQSWIPLKHRLLGLFAQTLECEHVPCFAAPTDGGQRLVPAPGIKPVYETHPTCAQHDARLGCGWPLQTFPVGWHDAAAAALAMYDDLCASEKARLARNRREFGGPCLPLNGSHTKQGETLHTLVQSLKACVTSGAAQPCRHCAPGTDVSTCTHARPRIPITPRQVGLLRRLFALPRMQKKFSHSYHARYVLNVVHYRAKKLSKKTTSAYKFVCACHRLLLRSAIFVMRLHVNANLCCD
jgi:hypothetical protein